MIPAVYGSASTMSQMAVCISAAQANHQQPALKVSPQKLQPTRRLPGRQQAPLLHTQFSSTDVGPVARSSPPEPAGSGPTPMELMSPAGHGGCRSPAHKPAGPAAARTGCGLGHGYPLCVSGVQSTLFRATPPRKQPGAGRGDSPQPSPDAKPAQQQPALRRSRRKPVATRLF